ncbi:MAG: transcription-repair coupling factor, partial [Treponema sp.]|nr:transcription-repair coupling factor [Treponema sp.]
MESLLSNSVRPVLSRWKSLQDGIKSITFPCKIEGLSGAANTFFIAQYIENARNKAVYSIQYNTTGRYSQEHNDASTELDFLIAVPDEKDARELETDLQTIFEDRARIYLLPWWGIVPYRSAARGSSVFGIRAGVLSRLAFHSQTFTRETKPRIFIITQRSLQTPLPPPDYIRKLAFSVHRGQQVDPSELAEKLSQIGYTRVPKTGVAGEFTLRGEVLDVYTPGNDFAYRLLFDFDQIEQIKTFSPESQATSGTTDSILVYPMKEVIWNNELIENLEKKFELSENGINDQSSVYLPLTEEARKNRDKLLSELKTSGESEGEELYYPVIFDRMYTILDYLSQNTPVFYLDYDRMSNAQENFKREYSGMYRKERQEYPVFPPRDILIPFEKLTESDKTHVFFRSLHTSSEKENDIPVIKFDTDPSKSFFGNINYLKEQLTGLLHGGWSVTVFADNPNQSLRIKEILKDFNISILPEAISQGFGIPECRTIIIQENEIFGRRKHVPKSLTKAKSQVIDTFVDLNEGDYVVHVNYGIGVFRGIQRVKAFGNERDYIKLEYAGEEFAFVPIEQVNLVQRYIGNEGEAPRLDTIGSKSWENRKNKVKKAVEDLAQKLIVLYSRRKASRGFPFPKDSEWQTAFEAAFPYEDTPDQQTATQEIKLDMEKPVPMDRLLCGDVGYGKTEIAMRAAFKAVMGGKQVAFLAPTTILAEQHYETCVERFANFPIKIAQLSRFVSPSEQKKTLAELASGKVDILVGTHRIIQKDVIFKDLGLMITDEEQRFGVKDKEKLKTIKANIDCLAMSATPIPRTLHMSLLKIRDMSMLTTPPQTRKPIETIVDEFTEERVAKAIRQEVERGGQVFFLHNRVETLEETCRKLEKIVPEMMIDYAHGQMSVDELDDIFRRFKMGGFHVLVATTIIENGIDIPNVNTIIIDRADMYGVSQLYQLRGRVGRSDRKAYAYLLYPENKVLSEVAMKRLQVISDFTELGSGFKIAMKDMEIRGAGNLLGKDQSGEVYSVGFDLYMRLLNDAVRHLTDEKYEVQNEVLMELEYTGFIPETYVPNLQTKMEIYKKVAAVQTKEELDGVYA